MLGFLAVRRAGSGRWVAWYTVIEAAARRVGLGRGRGGRLRPVQRRHESRDGDDRVSRGRSESRGAILGEAARREELRPRPPVTAYVTREHPETLERQLASLVGLQHSNFEVIVVDNGSTDDTPGVLAAAAGVVLPRLVHEAALAAGVREVPLVVRDTALLDWCATLLRDAAGEPAHGVEAEYAESEESGQAERDEIDAPAGTFVFVRDPTAKRKAVGKEGGRTFVCLPLLRPGSAADLLREPAPEVTRQPPRSA